MKTCSQCKIDKPFEAFFRDKATKDGYQPSCKECDKKRKQETKQSPLLQLEKQVRSSVILENKLLAPEGKKLCSGCRNIFEIEKLIFGCCYDCRKEHNKRHRGKLEEYQKQYQKEYYLKKKDKLKEYQKQYHEKNKEYHNERMKEYRLKKKLERLQNESM